MKGYYELHLSRLKDVREDVWKHEAAMRGLFEEWKREEGMGGWIEGGRAEMVGRVYKSMVREGERLRAGERGVGRLLGLCEVLLEGEEGFERVGWRRGG